MGQLQSPSETTEHSHGSTTSLALAAIGIVYGDIGTSPLYTMREVFTGIHGLPLTPDNILSVLSLIFWSLMIIVSLKYVLFIMRADNRGEGGIMALIALTRQQNQPKHVRNILMGMGIFGAALFYGDGVITPAISVLSAVEGLEVATPVLKSYVVPITILVLVGLFMFQRRGTASVGALFGPIMVIWFLVLAAMGILNIAQQPGVLLALNPIYAISFFTQHGWASFLALGAVVLAVTGAEALYADMGHFGRKPISAAWFWFVLPALMLNYLGQGAELIANPTSLANPFYHMAPDWALYPLIGLATMATVIASQAVISGAYSMTRQAMQLGYAPRMEIQHTSEQAIGQVYLPAINWGLLVAIVALVLGFQSSSNLAAAYGIAVTTTMVIDTALAFFVVRNLWRWSLPLSVLAFSLLLTVDLSYFAANTLKIPHGGWFPLSLGAVIFTVLSTWKRGREILFSRLKSQAIDLKPFLADMAAYPPTRVPGTAVFLSTNSNAVPHAMLHNLAHNKVLHERVVFLTVIFEDVPHVPDIDHAEVEKLGNDFYRIFIRYGFKDEPNIPEALDQCTAYGLSFSMLETSFFLSRETIIPTRMPGMALWREKLFASMAKNAGSATAYFRIPTNRVVELGTQIEI
jgi:KUP system potassium uptake protein